MGFLELPIASGLFIIVFVASALSYLRRRDALTAAVLLVFAASLPVFVARLLSFFFAIELPKPIGAAFSVALLAQPLAIMRLAAMLHPVPRKALLTAALGFIATAAPVGLATALATTTLPLPLTIATVGVFGATAGASALFFALAARRRTGSARMRLLLASGATILMAATLLLAGAAAAAPDAPLLGTATRYGVLLAALLYAIAFIAPPWLRRQWQARTGYELSRQLLTGSAESDADATWRHFAQLAADAAGVDQALVVVGAPESGARTVAAIGQLAAQELDSARMADLIAQAARAHQMPVGAAHPGLRELVGNAPERFVTLVHFDAAQDGDGLLVLVGNRRSLFAPDDRETLALLGAQAALLAGRAQTIAEHAALAAQLSATVEALSAASRAKNDFLANMSHELRTPLNAILGFSDLMRGETETDGRRNVPAQWIDHVHVAGRHLLELINDVLDLAKVEAGRLELQLQEVDAGAAVRDALADLRPLALQKNLTLTADGVSVVVQADRGRLRQILYNLISNSIKFTPEGGQVRVETAISNGSAHIAVVDTGVGIDPADHERIFEEFTQVGDATSNSAGTGLGLALTRRLVEAHGGHIALQSVVGAGSTFTVVLPRLASNGASGPAAVRARSSRPGTAGRASTAGATEAAAILVIEDDPQAVELLRSYLEPNGYRLIVAAEGVEGIALARRERPAAILLDVMLPGIDGWEVLRRLKADRGLSDIPVLIVTVVDERELGLALGAADYLLKPIDRESLMAAIRRHLPIVYGAARPRVLAADDDPVALEFVRATLEPAGYDVTVAGGGREAIYAAHRDPYDLIICDLVMPDLDGFEVVAQLKAAEETRHTPILILTAHVLDGADKSRLNGQIIGICDKGAGANGRLRDWLVAVVPPVVSVQTTP